MHWLKHWPVGLRVLSSHFDIRGHTRYCKRSRCTYFRAFHSDVSENYYHKRTNRVN